MREKLCVFCNHLGYEPHGVGAYAEPPMLACAKEHELKPNPQDWADKQQHIWTLEDFRTMILTAQNCDDYDEARP